MWAMHVSAAMISDKIQDIRQLKAEVKEIMHELDMDVAVEHHHEVMAAKETEKRMCAVQTLADTRRLKLKA